ncbi:hypothetical protein N7488_004698 [Penicillium malachiteum]|nr:hypothetical protein N7488_004698 [Penicillium malachiteum]
MAEVIGIVSGGLTFATVVAQVTKSVFEIRDFWGQIRDAPKDLQHLILEMEVYGSILMDIEKDLSDSSVVGTLTKSNHAMKSFELCRKAASDLDDVSTDLINDLGTTRGFKKKYASLKLVMKKGTVEKYVQRLRNANQLLSLSQQCYTSPQRRILKRPSNYDYVWRLALPSWMSSKCFELAGARVLNSWTWKFKIFNIVERPIGMSYAFFGDVEGLQRLFSSRKASPFDRTADGRTLMTMAFRHGHVETVNFLITQGAEINVLDDWEARREAVYGYYDAENTIFHSSTASIRLFKMLWEYYDELDGSKEEILWQFFFAFNAPPKAFFFIQKTFWSSFCQAPIKKRVSLAWKYLDIYYDHDPAPTVELLRIILRGIPFRMCPPQYASYTDFLADYGMVHFPARIARAVGHWLLSNQTQEKEVLYEPWSQLFRDFLDGGLDICCPVFGCGTSILEMLLYGLFTFSDGVPDASAATLNASIQYWLKDLQESGVNLANFGVSSEKHSKKPGRLQLEDLVCMNRYMSGQRVEIRLLGFSHGLSPEDWGIRISVCEYFYDFAGEFWKLIERRMEIPGGWSSDIPLFL